MRGCCDVYGDYQFSSAEFHDAGERIVCEHGDGSHQAAVPIDAEQGYVSTSATARSSGFGGSTDPRRALKAVGWRSRRCRRRTWRWCRELFAHSSEPRPAPARASFLDETDAGVKLMTMFWNLREAGR